MVTKLGLLLSIILISFFLIVVGNMVLPISSSKTIDFLNYIKYILRGEYNHNYYIQKYVRGPVIEPISRSLNEIDGNNNHRINYLAGPRPTYENNTQHYVTLTFYVQYGNQQHIPDLLDLLYHYNINKAVFLVEPRFMEGHPFIINTLRYAGYSVHSWNNLTEYDKNYSPTVFQGVPLSGNEVLKQVKKDSVAEAFYDIAIHYGNTSTIAFTPNIMIHKAILEEILKFNDKSIVFTDNDSNKARIENTSNPNYIKVNTNFFRASSNGYTDFVNFNSSRDLVVEDGIWTIDRLQAKYPSAISHLTTSNGKDVTSGFLIKKNILVGKGAELYITNHKLFLESSLPVEHNNSAVRIDVKGPGGKAIISNSIITSWNSILQAPDSNPFHPRPFIIARDGGKMNILNSTISHLGFSIGGISDTRFAIAAISYYNTGDFTIANSTIAFNYYGFYSSGAYNFKIVHNKIYGQTRYGLDPHTGSKNFIIAFNYIHDNGNQGIICSIECKNLTITDNLVEHNVEGIGLHWLTNSSIVKDNIVRYNQKYGIFIQKHSFYNIIKNNTVMGNGNGIGLLDGSNSNNILTNTIADNIGKPIVVTPDSQSNAIKENIFYSKKQYE